ncbi:MULTISPECIES: hypothetical protein [Ramlibacter]|uniref:Tetratricopeptide repeat protein n=1 Tax=Ramlibacter pinisoli TaxID=2682844 RepID=A0A6N8IQD6_9BURK|nr:MULTISPECIES: hypothetical protein [Ramlibacter]MBA2963083.1 hypothetical protein [Ramlibacter sp. CGMCC 1.13660]MVQ28053.1 hypothetical protein [Ramlibacter pinisoli]
MRPTLRRLVAAVFVSGAALAQAAPFTPASDEEVVEKLPLATDAAAKRVEGLRRQLAARPGDAALRIEVARRYFELAMAQGDPRLVGYASAAIAPLAGAGPSDPAYWLVRGQLEQYSHQFTPALDSLAQAARLAPDLPDAPAWRAAIFMVQARYPEAAAECERLAPIADPLFATGCSAYVQAATGGLRPAYERLAAAVAAAPQASPELLVWEHTRLAEMAQRLGDTAAAEHHYKAALAQGVTDQFLLGAYADFLLDARRPAEVLKLLAGWERSDVLLLRLALAGKATGARQAADWADQLRDRFAAAALRGDRLHEQEAARFALDVEGQPARALQLAGSNYQVQKEPRDAWILLRAALAARQPQAARPALDWLAASRYEDPALQALATQLGTVR